MIPLIIFGIALLSGTGLSIKKVNDFKTGKNNNANQHLDASQVMKVRYAYIVSQFLISSSDTIVYWRTATRFTITGAFAHPWHVGNENGYSGTYHDMQHWIFAELQIIYVGARYETWQDHLSWQDKYKIITNVISQGDSAGTLGIDAPESTYMSSLLTSSGVIGAIFAKAESFVTNILTSVSASNKDNTVNNSNTSITPTTSSDISPAQMTQLAMLFL